MNIYVMALFSTFVVFEGPFPTLEEAEEHIATTADLRPSASQQIVRSVNPLPAGEPIEFTSAVDSAAQTV